MPRHLATLSVLVVLFAPVAAVAADAHTGVHADRGEIVLLRDVSARPAYRQAPPGIALIVDPTPTREIHQSLGTGEMTDEDFATMSSGQVDARGGGATMPAQMTDRALQGSMGRLTGESSVFSGSSFGRSVGGATGAVTGATRGIAPTITGALSQLPMGGSQGNPGTGP
ncbi:hypothetical protein MNQ95_06555 [Pseudoxanthomonas daejeonensis]|uniref:hypothetical protein n=1 Tax=Pseudoxanthomonas daejeonensis TaxID=266062 RepID=UPI001F546CD7|nr:hypothetical protein [Pseudoxanthomonas daejeonensis]UNK58740.1 hypothetical protein MNQ95_06555 [Pseudoxanthomonas daejeonensis]